MGFKAEEETKRITLFQRKGNGKNRRTHAQTKASSDSGMHQTSKAETHRTITKGNIPFCTNNYEEGKEGKTKRSAGGEECVLYLII